jgi:hypothetical protein
LREDYSHRGAKNFWENEVARSLAKRPAITGKGFLIRTKAENAQIDPLSKVRAEDGHPGLMATFNRLKENVIILAERVYYLLHRRLRADRLRRCGANGPGWGGRHDAQHGRSMGWMDEG